MFHFMSLNVKQFIFLYVNKPFLYDQINDWILIYFT